MIDREHDLPVTRQAKVLNISRGSVYYLPRPVPPRDLILMRRMDELHMDYPFAGTRMLCGLLNNEGLGVGRKHVATLMKKIGAIKADKEAVTYEKFVDASIWKEANALVK